MDGYLLAGSAFGAVMGLLHGFHVWRLQAARGNGGALRGGYYALWTLALWTLFGSYVLAFWLLGALLLALSRLTAGRQPAARPG